MAERLSAATKNDNAEDYFVRAFRYIVKKRPAELMWIRSLASRTWNGKRFLEEYAWVVMVSGFRVEVIANLWPKVTKAFLKFRPPLLVDSRRSARRAALGVIRHEGKVDAVLTAAERLLELKCSVGLVIREMSGNQFADWIADWPYMGPANRLFLARNLGFRGFAKPDRHLQSLAEQFGYRGDVAQMCEDVGSTFGLDPSEVDIVLWRYRSEGEPSLADECSAGGFF